jgi:8-oxo-dGTP diphosphatase
MDSISPPIRNTVRALILRDQNILLLRKVGYAGGDRFALPGGGQELDETLEQALERECLEEIGTQVHIGNLIYVADCFKPRDTEPPSTRHLVEFLFSCSVPDEYVPVNGHHPDKHQLEVVWVRLDELNDKALYPRSMSNYLAEFKNADNTVYLGTIDW